MTTDDKKWNIFGGLAAGLLLLLMGVLAGGAALRESVTVDELAHIGAGVTYLQKLDLRMNQEHPPLPKVLAAIPLVVRGVHADYTHISWTVSERFLAAGIAEWVFGEMLLERWNEPTTVLAWARFPMLLMTLVLGLVVYVYARRLGGPWGGLLCLSVFVSTPTFLTFGTLVHTDISVTLFTLLTLWTFGEVVREPSGKNVLWFGLSLAGALLSKFTAGVLLFVFPAFALSLRWWPVVGQPTDKGEFREWRRRRRWATFKGILWAALFVYVFYFVFSWNQPTIALDSLGTNPAAMALRRLLLPPVMYLRAVFWVLITGRRPTFLLGHRYSHGVWFYFPVLFVLKSMLGFLGLLLLGLVMGAGRKWSGRPTGVAAIPEGAQMHWRALWVGLVVSTGACLVSQLSISIRHFTVPMVLLIMLLAPLPRMLSELRERTRAGAAVGVAAVAVLAISCLVTAVRTYPYYFPYVNALGGGRPAYTLVSDSNVDWNQSLPEVKRFAEQRGFQHIGVDVYGFSDPTVSVPQAEKWNCQKPAAEDAGKWVVLSANYFLDGQNCEWLLKYPHEPLAHGSMYAMQLPTPIPEAGQPGGPPLPSDYRYLGGALFDINVFFQRMYDHPEKIQPVVTWMEDMFNNYRKTGKRPEKMPKLPWEE